jgi:membrane-bound metal-dependent hydrolase YbcI (DUF457 family)
MQGPTHLMLSWYLAESTGVESARDRRIVAWAGFAPDLDVLAYAGAIVWYGFDKDLAYENVWQVVHHRYTHGMLFVLLSGVVAWWLASRSPARARVALLALLASAIHNFCDLVGGGPTWPIYPVWPFSDFKWYASWSWAIGEWPNLVILFGCLGAMLLYAWAVGRSPVECFGDRANSWFTAVVRGERKQTASPGAARLRWLIWLSVVAVTIAILAPLGFNPFD